MYNARTDPSFQYQRDGAPQPFPDDTQSPWSLAGSAPEPSVESALEKDRIIKDILSLRDGLRGLMVRVIEVNVETEKLDRDNLMLGVYIDNLSA